MVNSPKVVNTVPVPADMYRTGMYIGIETSTFRTSLNTGRTSHTSQFRAGKLLCTPRVL